MEVKNWCKLCDKCKLKHTFTCPANDCYLNCKDGKLTKKCKYFVLLQNKKSKVN